MCAHDSEPRRSTFAIFLVRFLCLSTLVQGGYAATRRIGYLAPIDKEEGELTFSDLIPAGILLAVELANSNTDSVLELVAIAGPTQGHVGIGELQTLNFSGVAVDPTVSTVPLEPVDVMIGPTISDVAIHAALVGASFGIPLISPSATSPILSDSLYSTFSRTISSDKFQGQALAELLRYLGITAVAVLSTTDNYSTQFAMSFIDAAGISETEGIEIVRQLSFDTDDTDIAQQVTRIKDSDVAVIVLLVASNQPALTALEEFDRQGMIGPQYTYIGGDGWIGAMGDSTPELARLLYGTIGTTGFVDDSTEAYQEFLEIWENSAYSSSTPSAFSAYAYDAANLAIEALSQWDNLEEAEQTSEALLSFIRTTELDGVTGAFRLNSVGDRIGNYAFFNYQYNQTGDGYEIQQIGRSFHEPIVTGNESTLVIEVELDNLDDIAFAGGFGVLPESFVPIQCETQSAKVNRDECSTNALWIVTFEYVPQDDRTCINDSSSDGDTEVTLACDYLPYKSSWAVILIIVTSICLGITILAGVSVVMCRNHNSFVQSQPEWILCSIFGAVVCQLILFASLGNHSTQLCRARYALFFFGWNFFFTGVYSKAFRSVEIQRNLIVWMSFKNHMARLSILLMAQLSLFVVWFAYDSPQIVDDEVFVRLDLQDIQVDGAQKCDFSSENQLLFPTLLAFNIIWLLYTTTLAYRIRDVRFNNREARLVSAPVLLILACSAVAFPFMFTKSNSAREVVTRSTLLLLIAVTGTVLILVVPKLQRVLRGEGQKGVCNAFGSLESILGNKISSFYLREYLRSKLSAETVDFLDSVRRYQLFVENPEVSDEETVQKAVAVYSLHIEEESPTQINVSYQLRDNLRGELDVLESKRNIRASVSLFDEIVLEIKSLIFSNHYHNFLKNGESFAAQRALEWASEYKGMGLSLQKSIVIQLFEEYHRRKRDSVHVPILDEPIEQSVNINELSRRSTIGAAHGATTANKVATHTRRTCRVGISDRTSARSSASLNTISSAPEDKSGVERLAQSAATNKFVTEQLTQSLETRSTGPTRSATSSLSYVSEQKAGADGKGADADVDADADMTLPHIQTIGLDNQSLTHTFIDKGNASPALELDSLTSATPRYSNISRF